MATTYKTPGVYIEEIPKLPASVAQVETAIPAFIGYTEKQPLTVDNTISPIRIDSMLEYETNFGGPFPESGIQIILDQQLDESDNILSENITVDLPSGSVSGYNMYYAMQVYFSNGGGPCYIASVGTYDTSSPATNTDLLKGLTAIEKEDEPTLIVFCDHLKVASAQFYGLYKSSLGQCNQLQDRFTIVDLRSDSDGEKDTFRTAIGTSYLKYGAAYSPWLVTSLNYHFLEDEVQIQHNIFKDGVEGSTAGTLHDTRLNAVEETNTALYNRFKQEIVALTVTLPPSSAIAGIYARVDANRGVWKSPANVSLNSVIAPTVKLSHLDQESLNVDPVSGKSINAIRTFFGKGVMVWGARTLAGNDNEWRYISVRRFFNMVEESVKKSTAWAVFEPNTANTWIRIKGMIDNYLTELWRDGALAGPKAEDAFYVSLGLGRTMTQNDILEGRLNVEIGLAVARPAEFIVLKFSHKLQEAG